MGSQLYQPAGDLPAGTRIRWEGSDGQYHGGYVTGERLPGNLTDGERIIVQCGYARTWFSEDSEVEVVISAERRRLYEGFLP